MINWDRISELRHEVGKDDFGEVLKMFFEEVELVLAGIETSAASGKLLKDLHFLKGSALNLGFDAMSEICRRAEDAVSGGKIDDINCGLIQSAYLDARTELCSTLG
jgi:HPt (histidine-containing phosphotransfer) domain-containing protein